MGVLTRYLKRAVSTVAVIGTASLLVTVSQASATTTATKTLFSFVSQPGDYIGQGMTKSFTPANGTFVLGGTNLQAGLMFHNSDYSENWNLDLRPGLGDTLHVGTYAGAERAGFQTGRNPGLALAGDGRGCNTVYGSFAINQIGFDPAGHINLLDATFTQRCETSTAPALNGRVLLNALPLSYSFKSDAGDYIGQGLTKTYTNARSVIQLGAYGSGVAYSVSGLGDTIYIWITPAVGQQLKVGTFATTRSADATHFGLDAIMDSRGCNTSSGTLTIKSIVRTNGAVTGLSATFVQHCEGMTPALYGTIHYFQ